VFGLRTRQLSQPSADFGNKKAASGHMGAFYETNPAGPQTVASFRPISLID
jgi:hypothetical protein